MGIKHKVCINIANPGGTPGQQVNVLVLSPGDSVQTVEIHELKGGENHDKR